jgi:hypothetical protein
MQLTLAPCCFCCACLSPFFNFHLVGQPAQFGAESESRFFVSLACTHILDTRLRFLKTSKPVVVVVSKKKEKIIKTSWEKKNLHNPKHKSYSSWEIVDAYIYKLQASKELRQPTTIGQVFYFLFIYLFPSPPTTFFFLSFHPP